LDEDMILQALVSDTCLRSPYTVDTVATQNSNGIAADGRSGREAKLSLVGLRASIREALLRIGFDLAAIFENEGICTHLVERGAALDSLESDDTCVMCE
jgi:hypothetical protein